MSVITIYPNEALQYYDALCISLIHLENELTRLSDRAPEDLSYIDDNAITRMRKLEDSIALIKKMVKQIEANVSLSAK